MLALQVAVAGDGNLAGEELTAHQPDGSEPLTVTEVGGAHGGRVHVVSAPSGPITVAYTATVSAPTVDLSLDGDGGASPWADEVITALRQSRYCPSDVMAPFARAELGVIDDPREAAASAAAWVFERIAYLPGSSGAADTAADTLLAGRGVCRDFAHLTITLCRSLGVPARLASAYAPGLVQMDFHAVVEVWVGDRWEVLDPTRLAPRSSLVRIATGRDAADTAFAATLRGDVELVTSEVFAVVDGDLDGDDHRSPTVLGHR